MVKLLSAPSPHHLQLIYDSFQFLSRNKLDSRQFDTFAYICMLLILCSKNTLRLQVGKMLMACYLKPIIKSYRNSINHLSFSLILRLLIYAICQLQAVLLERIINCMQIINRLWWMLAQEMFQFWELLPVLNIPPEIHILKTLNAKYIV